MWDSSTTRIFILSPYRAYQDQREFAVSLAYIDRLSKLSVLSNSHDVSWKSPGDGAGTALLEVSSPTSSAPTISLDATETWHSGERTAERRALLTLPTEVSAGLFAFLKTLYEPESSLLHVALETAQPELIALSQVASETARRELVAAVIAE